MNALSFNMMALWFKLRDMLTPPKNVLSEAGIEPGFHVLDYGCGPGSFSIAAAELVGQSGKVYAADINPLAVQRVQNVAASKGLGNVETIHTDCATGLQDHSLDLVLLYDTYHDLTDPDGVLQELHRILKPAATLSFSDHHMKENDILDQVTRSGLFELSSQGQKTFTFSKRGQ
ncbi:MAG: class I SAM-dependent methyltransferase [Anaerolineae bacterium]|jgi:ubiquinone/menaquinone biosynthesis C-methylase UbiE